MTQAPRNFVNVIRDHTTRVSTVSAMPMMRLLPELPQSLRVLIKLAGGSEPKCTKTIEMRVAEPLIKSGLQTVTRVEGDNLLTAGGGYQKPIVH